MDIAVKRTLLYCLCVCVRVQVCRCIEPGCGRVRVAYTSVRKYACTRGCFIHGCFMDAHGCPMGDP